MSSNDPVQPAHAQALAVAPLLEKAAKRQAVCDQIASIDERLQARRSRLVQALHAFAATFPASGPGGVELPTQHDWLESVADALLAVCQAVRDGGFSQGLEEILRSDREDAGDNDRLAIALYRRGWCNDRQGILALLEQLARLPKRQDNLDRSAACQAQVWAAVQAWFGAFLPWPPVPDAVHCWHPDRIEMDRLAQELKPRPSPGPSRRPAPTSLPPLVGENKGRRAALRELARDPDRERQARYCQGFAPDWWLPALVCPKWRTPWYPLEPTPESVEQWVEFIDKLLVEYLGPFDMPQEAAELDAQRASDLALIGEHRPELHAAVMPRLATPHVSPGERAAASGPTAQQTDVAPVGPAEETVESPPQQAVEVEAATGGNAVVIVAGDGGHDSEQGGERVQEPPRVPPPALNSIRLEAQVWHLAYGPEKGEFPKRGNQGIKWLAQLLLAPNRSLTVAELRGDPEGKLRGDSLLRGESASDWETVRGIKARLDEIDDITAETGGSEALENEKADLLTHLEAADDSKQITNPLRTAHHNIATQFRNLLRDQLGQHMPQLAAHLKAALKLDFPHFGYYPPASTPSWNS
jgi:hypothetical protein